MYKMKQQNNCHVNKRQFIKSNMSSYVHDFLKNDIYESFQTTNALGPMLTPGAIHASLRNTFLGTGNITDRDKVCFKTMKQAGKQTKYTIQQH
jgi:hypothetical protein